MLDKRTEEVRFRRKIYLRRKATVVICFKYETGTLECGNMFANRAPTRLKPEIREVEVNGGKVYLVITDADYAKSKDILSKNGLRLLTRQEALAYLTQNSKLKEQLKGKAFWLADKGSKDDGCYTIDSEGNIKPGEGNPEKTVNIGPGPSQLLLGVSSDVNVNWRFEISANSVPENVLRIVVGVKNIEQSR